MDNIDPSWGLNNADFLQQVAMLGWLQGGDESKKYLENVTGMRVGYELWQRLSGQRELDSLRNKTIASICKYVQDHPRASKEELTKEVAKQIQLFAHAVEKL